MCRKFVIAHDDQRKRLKDAHFLLLLLSPLLGIGFGLLLRLLPGFFFVFEFLYSGVAAVSRVCKSTSGWKTVSTGASFASSRSVRRTGGAYRLAFVSCSSPPSSSELSRPGSAFRSTSSRHDCGDRLNTHWSDAGPTTAFAVVDTSKIKRKQHPARPTAPPLWLWLRLWLRGSSCSQRLTLPRRTESFHSLQTDQQCN